MANRPRSSVSNVRGWQDLVAVTGLGEDSIKAGIISGELPGYRVGKSYVIPADAFDAFCEGRWVPQPRRVFSEPVQPLTTPEFIHRRRAS